MSTICFTCENEKREALKTGVWEILRGHYFRSVHPSTRAEYKDEGEAVYLERLNKLMEERICRVEDTDDGISIEFDSTEDAGDAIAEEVYRTQMGYSDDGLTWVDPIFEEIVEKFPGICFEADAESSDEWAEEENHYAYDGECLLKDGIPIGEELYVAGEEAADPEPPKSVSQTLMLHCASKLQADSVEQIFAPRQNTDFQKIPAGSFRKDWCFHLAALANGWQAAEKDVCEGLVTLAKTDPSASFSARFYIDALCFAADYLYENGVLKAQIMETLDTILFECPECGADLEEPVDFYEHHHDKTYICPSCGKAVSYEKTFEEKIITI